MRLIILFLTTALNVSLNPALAEVNESMETKHLGTPVNQKNVVDVLEIQRIISNLTNGADAANWDVVLDILTDRVETTIGQSERGVSAIMTSEEIASRWGGFYETADKFVMHHLTSNERVYFANAHNATVYAKGVIALENTPAGAYAQDGGKLRGYRWVNYEFGLTRKNKSWKVNKILVEYQVEQFDSLKP